MDQAAKATVEQAKLASQKLRQSLMLPAIRRNGTEALPDGPAPANGGYARDPQLSSYVNTKALRRPEVSMDLPWMMEADLRALMLDALDRIDSPL